MLDSGGGGCDDDGDDRDKYEGVSKSFRTESITK
jgi:hypothetical protein